MIAHPETLLLLAVVGGLLFVLHRWFGGSISKPLQIDEDLHGPSISGWDHGDSSADGDGDGSGDGGGK